MPDEKDPLGGSFTSRARGGGDGAFRAAGRAVMTGVSNRLRFKVESSGVTKLADEMHRLTKETKAYADQLQRIKGLQGGINPNVAGGGGGGAGGYMPTGSFSNTTAKGPGGPTFSTGPAARSNGGIISFSTGTGGSAGGGMTPGGGFGGGTPNGGDGSHAGGGGGSRGGYTGPRYWRSRSGGDSAFFQYARVGAAVGGAILTPAVIMANNMANTQSSISGLDRIASMYGPMFDMNPRGMHKNIFRPAMASNAQSNGLMGTAEQQALAQQMFASMGMMLRPGSSQLASVVSTQRLLGGVDAGTAAGLAARMYDPSINWGVRNVFNVATLSKGDPRSFDSIVRDMQSRFVSMGFNFRNNQTLERAMRPGSRAMTFMSQAGFSTEEAQSIFTAMARNNAAPSRLSAADDSIFASAQQKATADARRRDDSAIETYQAQVAKNRFEEDLTDAENKLDTGIRGLTNKLGPYTGAIASAVTKMTIALQTIAPIVYLLGGGGRFPGILGKILERGGAATTEGAATTAEGAAVRAGTGAGAGSLGAVAAPVLIGAGAAVTAYAIGKGLLGIEPSEEIQRQRMTRDLNSPDLSRRAMARQWFNKHGGLPQEYGDNPFGIEDSRLNPEVKKDAYHGLAGMNPELRRRVLAMFAANPKLSLTSGFRTRAEQEYAYRTKPGIAAAPGKSLHEVGLAADISDGEGGKWLMAHAAQFGLVTGRTWGEPWHIQLAGSVRKEPGYDPDWRTKYPGGGNGSGAPAASGGAPTAAGTAAEGLFGHATAPGGRGATMAGVVSAGLSLNLPSLSRASGGLSGASGVSTASVPSGGKLTMAQIAQAAYAAGFRGEALTTMVAVAMRESSGDSMAHNTNRNTRDNSYGLWQINMLGAMGPDRMKSFGLSKYEDLFDPLTNARAAFKLSGGGDMASIARHWYINKPGYREDYMKYMTEAQSAVKSLGYGDLPSSATSGGSATIVSSPIHLDVRMNINVMSASDAEAKRLGQMAVSEMERKLEIAGLRRS